jgi:hypothetical protein
MMPGGEVETMKQDFTAMTACRLQEEQFDAYNNQQHDNELL